MPGMNGWEILQQIWRLQRVVLREATPCLERHGLFRMAPFALAMVRRCGTPSGVAAALGLPAPTVSHILRRLEAEGWIARELDPEDRRRYRLALTPAGQEALAAARACLQAAMDRHLETLTPAERETLRQLLLRLQGDRPAPGRVAGAGLSWPSSGGGAASGRPASGGPRDGAGPARRRPDDGTPSGPGQERRPVSAEDGPVPLPGESGAAGRHGTGSARWDAAGREGADPARWGADGRDGAGAARAPHGGPVGGGDAPREGGAGAPKPPPVKTKAANGEGARAHDEATR